MLYEVPEELAKIVSQPTVSEPLSLDTDTFSPSSPLVWKHFQDNFELGPARLNCMCTFAPANITHATVRHRCPFLTCPDGFLGI